jgi:hypothetical protein
MQDAHEPGRREALERHAPERVLVEVADVQDAKARSRRVEELMHHTRRVIDRPKDDEIRPFTGDDRREIGEATENVLPRPVAVVDDSDADEP